MRRTVVTLSAIAFALVAMTGYAKAPSFGNLPDVIISDQEANEGFTTDYNFFEYLNAFDILTYAQDEDSSTASDLKYVFTEMLQNTNDIQINGKTQLDLGAYDENDPSTWPAGSLIIPDGQGSGGDFTVSFQDLIRSPGPFDGVTPFPDPLYEEGGAAVTMGDTGIFLPWHDASGNLVRTPDVDTPSRMITIWAGDEDDNPGSGSLMVYSVNELADDLSGLLATIFTDDLPGDNTDDWISETVAGIGAATTGATGNLTLAAPAFTGSNFTYTRWRLRNYGELAVKPVVDGVPTPYPGWVPIEYVPDDSVIYSARFTMQHDQAARETVPSMRIGINDALTYQVALTYIGTFDATSSQTANSQWPDQNTPRVYRQYFANNPGPSEASLDLGDGTGVVNGWGGDLRNFNGFWDILNKNANGVGELTMSYFEVVTMPRPADSTKTAHDPETDFVLDQVNSETLKATGVQSAGTLALTIPASTAGGTVPWILYSEFDAVQMTPDTLVRVQVELSCPQTSDRDNFKQFRVRFNAPFFQQDQLYYIQQYDPALAAVVGYPSLPPSQQASPGATATYDVYMPVYMTDTTDLQGINPSGPADLADYFYLGLDYVGNPNAAAMTTASTVTVHSVTSEVLSMPAL
jgi:hypothetical protein